MRLNAVNILKISITSNPKIQILEEIRKYLDQLGKKRQKTLKIYTPNSEQLVFAAKNSNFLNVIKRADIAIPDSVGVVWAGHILTKNGPGKPIPGVEFMEDLAALAVNRHVPIGLIGGKANLAIDTLNCLRENHPGLSGWAVSGPEFEIDQVSLVEKFSRQVAQKIRETKAAVVFVALGPPKQEYFIERLAKDIQQNVILMAVGGSFDIVSGRLPRAPVYLRKLGLEWFWRLILEPRRIFRQLALIEFIWLVLREKIRPS